MVLILGGKDVMSLLYAPNSFAIVNIIVWGLLGEELKCQGPTQRKTWKLGESLITQKADKHRCDKN